MHGSDLPSKQAWQSLWDAQRLEDKPRVDCDGARADDRDGCAQDDFRAENLMLWIEPHRKE